MWFNGDIETGNIISRPRGMTINGVQYPPSIFSVWTQDELATLEIYPYRENSINQQYYWQGQLTKEFVDGGVVGTYGQIDRDVDQLKEHMIDATRSVVSSMLARDDWMVAREFEGGTKIPSDTVAYRSALRTESNTKESEINALTTIDEVIAYRERPAVETRKIKHTAEDGTETWGPETEAHDRNIDMVLHYEAVDPSAEIDPAFVSLVFS
jgi:hypothetical protein